MSCLHFNAQCMYFYVIAAISLLCLGFSFVRLITIQEDFSCSEHSVYITLIGTILGFWMPNPRLDDAKKYEFSNN